MTGCCCMETEYFSNNTYFNLKVNEACNFLYKEYGYTNDPNIFSVPVMLEDSIVRLSWVSPNKTPFLILFIVRNGLIDVHNIDKYLDINDRFCTYFVVLKDNSWSFYRRNIRMNDYESCRELPIYKCSKSAQSDLPRVLADDFENFFFDAHSIIRDFDGLHPDEALDELCKLIYCKLYDEDSRISSRINYFDPSQYGNAEEYAASLRKLYDDANKYDQRVYSLRIPGYKRSRGVFDEPIKLSSLSVTKVSELFSKVSFTNSDIDIKARAFQNVYKPAARSGMGQYFTPINVIKFIVKAINPLSDELLIDPFCGSAHFLTESIKNVQSSGGSQNRQLDFIFHKLHGIEKSERMVRIAMTDMRLHGDGHSNIRCTDALLPFGSYYDIEPNSFDIVMTNPPFGSTLTGDSFKYLGEFSLNKGRKRVPLEVVGLERCIQLLREGGRMAIVLPESIFANKSYEHVREWLKSTVKIRAIISLPIETFAPYGTNIKTSILFCTKSSIRNASDYKIFVGSIDNIGYDASGRDRKGSDWETLLGDFTKFLGLEGW